MKFLPLILAGLKRKKLRTTLTFLSIFVAFLLFAFLGAMKEALGGGVSMAGQDRLITRHKVSMIQTLPESYKTRIQSVAGVDAVCAQLLQEYDVAPDACRAEVETFLAELVKHEAIALDPPQAA